MTANHVSSSNITTLRNGTEIFSTLESRGFEHFIDDSNEYGDIFYFRRASIVLKVLTKIILGGDCITGVWVYYETFNLESYQYNKLETLHERRYISVHDTNEFVKELDSNLEFEDKFILVNNFERNLKSLNETETLGYLESCYIGWVNYHDVKTNFLLV